MRKLLTIRILLVALLPIAVFGQSDTYHRQVSWAPVETIHPGDSVTFKRLSFEGASFASPVAKIPRFTELIQINSREAVEKVRIRNIHYEKVSYAEREILQDKQLPATPDIHSSRVKQRDQVFQHIALTPIVFKDGSFFKLTAFDLELEKSSISEPSQKQSFRSSSVLANGDWYKLKLKDDGIYKLSYEYLQNQGVDVNNIDPDNIGIFGNTGKMLPEVITESQPDDLTENPVKVVGGADGSFDAGDYILFFGHGPVYWEYAPLQLKFKHLKNYYTDYSYYFLTTTQGTGKRLEQQEQPAESADETVETYDDYRLYENDMVNLIESGRIWYGEKLDNTREEMTFPEFEFKNVVPGSRLYLQTDIAARSTITSKVYLYANGEEVYNHTVASVQPGEYRYFRPNTRRNLFDEAGDNYTITMEYPAPTSSSSIWLNWLELSARCELKYNDEQLLFRDKESVGSDKVVRYVISNAPSSLEVWDVSNPLSPKIIATDYSNNQIRFKAHAEEIRQYAAFAGQEYLEPEFEGEVANQNLHALKNIDFLIVSHPDFLEQAKRLADFREQHDNLDCLVTTPQKIYNEFSSGGQDITAIRNFARLLYINSDSTQRLKYLLMFGKASFDYKDIHDENTNYVPTFQAYNSNNIGGSYLTDDYFGLLNVGEGHDGRDSDELLGLLDIGIGRLPAKTPEDAQIMVDKILHYHTSPETLGQWRNEICLVADDEDSNMHLTQSEKLATIIDTAYSQINLQKIYLDSYRQESIPGGERYPEVNNAIKARMEKGALIMNYTGHGGETGWAHENIINTSDVEGWKNYNALPLFITATCEFSRFDNPELISAGEKTFLNPDGGSIGLLSTTRLAFSHTNSILNVRVFRKAFTNNDGSEHPRLGDLVIASKTPMDDNLYNFVLLGDPSMNLEFPEKKVVTTSIEESETEQAIDTLKALKKITIKGEVQDYSGKLQTDFNGTLTPIVYDKEYSINTLKNDPGSYLTTFEVQDNILYKGKVSINQGAFDFTFMVPKDINYSFGKGKLSYYARSDSTDAGGHSEDVIVGGSAEEWDGDNEGPEIEVYMNDSTFEQGDVVNASPVLFADIWDESGLNTTGNGIGHDLSAKVSGKSDEYIILNDFYTSSMDSYKGGQVEYPFNNLPEGEYELTLKAWDVYNNSSEKTITFVVSENISPYISSVKCYPNPFQDKTQFAFTHNQYNERLSVTVDIYSMHGQHVRHLGPVEVSATGYTMRPLEWDGRDQYGNRTKKGMYIYTVIIKTQQGETYRKSGKLVKTN